jgi:hypothetical protein
LLSHENESALSTQSSLSLSTEQPLSSSSCHRRRSKLLSSASKTVWSTLPSSSDPTLSKSLDVSSSSLQLSPTLQPLSYEQSSLLQSSRRRRRPSSSVSQMLSSTTTTGLQ